MKNIANYLDDYMSDDFEFESKEYKFESCCKKMNYKASFDGEYIKNKKKKNKK